ncbi:MAG: ribonuclease P protein component [Prevotella sp.]|nr:ribonuclease P protein component [Prevotella sp.]
MAAPTFRKQERIVSTRLIEMLFGKGNSQSLSAFPLRAVFVQTARQPSCAPVQILISVPKKRFKHAVDRNRVKRQIREAYRHQKQLLEGVVAEDKQLLIAFIWLSDRHYQTSEVEKRVIGLLERIAAKS